MQQNILKKCSQALEKYVTAWSIYNFVPMLNLHSTTLS